MPLFERLDPEIGSLIAYLVARSRERDVTLTQTKLVKLLYLIDVERLASGRPPLTGLDWVFYHYGPYALELPSIIEPLEDRTLTVTGYKDSRLYRAAPDAPSGEEWPPATRRQVDQVLRRFAPMELNELLDHVYFHTAPMRDARRGEPLDMARARSERPGRLEAPLGAPELSGDAGGRLAAWRRGRGERLTPSDVEERQFFTDPERETIALEGLHGRMTVSDEERHDG